MKHASVEMGIVLDIVLSLINYRSKALVWYSMFSWFFFRHYWRVFRAEKYRCEYVGVAAIFFYAGFKVKTLVKRRIVRNTFVFWFSYAICMTMNQLMDYYKDAVNYSGGFYTVFTKSRITKLDTHLNNIRTRLV